MTDRLGGDDRPAEDSPRIEIGALTDVGRVRTGNEDSILDEPLDSPFVATRGLFVAVADGMGGHAAGEEASSMAVSVARDAYYAGGEYDINEALRLAIVKANLVVYEAGAGKTGRDHMGSTLTAAVIEDGRVVVGHVGDSRAYVIDGEAIRQLTLDHSWVAEQVRAGRMSPDEARVSPRRNIITRALGLRPEVEVDVYDAVLEPGMSLLICSDGLHGLVSDDEMLAYVSEMRPKDAVGMLVDLANRRGGPDNISVIIARMKVEGEIDELSEDEIDTLKGFERPRVLSIKDSTTPMPAYQPTTPSEPSSYAPVSEPSAFATDDSPHESARQQKREPIQLTPEADDGPEAAPDRRGSGIVFVVVAVLLILIGLGVAAFIAGLFT